MAEEKEEIEKLEEQTSLLSSDEVTEEQLQDILKQIQVEEAIDDQREAEHNDWLAKREAKILEIKKFSRFFAFCLSREKPLISRFLETELFRHLFLKKTGFCDFY